MSEGAREGRDQIEQPQRYRIRDQFVSDGYKASIIDTHGANNPELHEPLSLTEICQRLNDDEKPDFTHDDPDLDNLLNWTAALCTRRATMDTGIAWKEALDAVEARLALSRVVIVQAVKPGDVVFLELQRSVSDQEIEHIKAMIDTADIGVKMVLLPSDIKVATGKANG